MALDDYLEPEIAITAIVAAAIFSPRGRQILRKGAVYGLAGVLVAGDALSTAGRNLGQGLQRAGVTAGATTKTTWAQAQSAISHNGNATTEMNGGKHQGGSQVKEEQQEHPGGQQ